MSMLYDQKGKRKYLTMKERGAFLEAAEREAPEVYTFCVTLAFTGARISEVLALVPEHVDFVDGAIIFECLKKRRRGIYRVIPVPMNLLVLLDQVHCIRQLQHNSADLNKRIWPRCRTTAWNNVKRVMANAHIQGPHACPKGLRHSFGVSAIQKAVPLNIVRKWLGHSRLTTTAIYADAMGDEERKIAGLFWKSFE